MENSKKVLVYVGGILLLVFVLFGVAALFFRLGVNRTKEMIASNSSKPLEQSKNLVSDFEAVPSTITGTVTEIKDDSIEIKQFANFDLKYEIKKADISEVVLFQKNPQFSQENLEQKRKELEEKLKTIGVDVSKINQPPVEAKEGESQKQAEIQKIMDEFSKATQEDPTLQNYLETPTEFEQIKVGSQVNFVKNEEGKGKILVYPDDMNVGPPK